MAVEKDMALLCSSVFGLSGVVYDYIGILSWGKDLPE
jgi:hypothetical protein